MASTIYLFGSSLDRGSEPNDIDLAVERIRPEMVFKFYGELLRYSNNIYLQKIGMGYRQGL